MAKTAAQDANLTEWTDPPKEKRDLKKTFLVAGLAILSWVATYVGMLELIEANMGELPIVHKIIIGFSVAMLMTMIVWLLDQLFQPISLFTKTVYAAGYIFLSIISIGFGFGFYWKVLESKGEGTRVAETAVGSVQAPLQTAATRLESLSKTLDNLAQISLQKAEQERTAGTSCPNSKPGDGPRRRLRDDDSTRFAGARDFVKGRIDGVKSDIAAIEGEFSKIAKNDASIVSKDGTRNEFMKGLNRRLDQTVNNFNAFKSDPQLRTIRAELDDRGNKTQFIDTTGKPYACPDPGLTSLIKAVVASIDGLPTLEKPKIATVEGSDATIEAFRRLTATFIGALSFKLPPSAEELRDLQKKAIATAEASPEKRSQMAAQALAASGAEAGLSKRDYIPLSVAIFVDICLLLVSMGRPSNRLGNLVPKMQAAERGPVIQILSRFNEIHKDQQVRANFEIFRHVVFDLNGDYYVAVPLDAPPRMNPKDREELRLEAQLLANLFTSFEQEKIFARVLLPYITTKQIQKKLWKQGSKFAHAETFRLYKFKDGAWSEIILGAIMGAAKRVEAQKRLRRIEEDVFTRHEPSFAGPTANPVSQQAVAAAQGHFQSQAPFQADPATVQAMPSRPVAPPPPFVHRPIAPAASAATEQSRVMPLPVPPAAHRPSAAGPATATAAAFGPYAFAAAAEVAADAEPRPVQDIVADLNAHRQRVELQTEVAVRVANSNTAPVAPNSTADRHDVAAVELINPVTSPPETMKIEAVERRVTFHVPTRDQSMPVSLNALLTPALHNKALEQINTETRISQDDTKALTVVPADVVDADHDDTFRPTVALPNDDATTTIASRFAPLTVRNG
jgi:hypothetical protein